MVEEHNPTKVIAHRFVSHDIPALETMRNSKIYLMKVKLMNGEKLTREGKDYLFENLVGNSYSRMGVPLHGWMFDFAPWLNRYWVKDRFGNLYEYYAVDKTSIRAWVPEAAEIVLIQKGGQGEEDEA